MKYLKVKKRVDNRDQRETDRAKFPVAAKELIIVTIEKGE